jgi:hypothetical protein
MAVGETLRADGITWALVSKRAGFSGGHWAFRPHNPLVLLSPAQREQAERKVVTLRQAIHLQLRAIRPRWRAVLAIPEPLTFEEAQASFTLASTTHAALEDLAGAIRTAGRTEPRLRRLISPLAGRIRAARYQDADLRRFIGLQLGELTQDQALQRLSQPTRDWASELIARVQMS